MPPKPATLVNQLEELAYKLGIDVLYEDLATQDLDLKGGFCRFRDKNYIIVDQRQSMEQQAKIIAKALARFDLDSIYVRPALRDFIFIHEKI